MDAFVSRKRRHSSTPKLAEDEVVTKDTIPSSSQDDTDFKLALLASLQPGIEHESLLEALLAHDGNVEAASSSLSSGENISPRKKLRASGAIGYQSSLSSFNIISTSADGESKSVRPLTKK